MLPPLPRCSSWVWSSLILTQPYQLSPKGASGRPAHRPFRGLLAVHSRCGLHTRAGSYSCSATRRLQTFRLLHASSGCFRRERLRRVGLAPTGKRRLVTAHPHTRLFSRGRGKGEGERPTYKGTYKYWSGCARYCVTQSRTASSSLVNGAL